MTVHWWWYWWRDIGLCLVIDPWYACFKIFQGSGLVIKITLNSFRGFFDIHDSSYSILWMFDIPSILLCSNLWFLPNKISQFPKVKTHSILLIYSFLFPISFIYFIYFLQTSHQWSFILSSSHTFCVIIVVYFQKLRKEVVV